MPEFSGESPGPPKRRSGVPVADVAVGTVITTNFLPFARVLAQSLREHHPGIPFYALLSEEAGAEGFEDENIRFVPLSTIGITEIERLRFRYSRRILPLVLKPYILEHLLNLGFPRAILLDSDMLITGDMSPLLAMPHECAIALTPHLSRPQEGPDRVERELVISRAGTYNAGFVSVSDSPEARRFIQWWRDRLSTHCTHDVARGLHGDQRWLDLVPSLFEGVFILADPACNVAYWNLEERDFRMEGDQPMAAGAPCRFFHFSGFDPRTPQTLTRHVHPSTGLSHRVGPLLVRYAKLLMNAGYGDASRGTYQWDYFDNGVQIPDAARILYRELGEKAELFGNPFETSSPPSFFNWLQEPAIPGATSGVTRVWECVYRQRLDVQNFFPEPHGRHKEPFLQWAMSVGRHEHGVHDCFFGSGMKRTVPNEEAVRG